jgi:hypothetical protein
LKKEKKQQRAVGKRKDKLMINLDGWPDRLFVRTNTDIAIKERIVIQEKHLKNYPFF